ncbi:hypothetical protein KA016_00015 [Candidatus Saccharibacteria bacterium]|jgi:hypothetical protein|nr:hypothetical protein [Candidatus Saccharibacteria bacterium]
MSNFEVHGRILRLTSALSLPYGVIAGAYGVSDGIEEGFGSPDSLSKLAIGIGFLSIGAASKWLEQRQSTIATPESEH